MNWIVMLVIWSSAGSGLLIVDIERVDTMAQCERMAAHLEEISREHTRADCHRVRVGP